MVATPTELFVNPAGGDYHLRAGSPAIDRGTSTGAAATDYEGHARPQGAGYDIGHDEFVLDPASARRLRHRRRHPRRLRHRRHRRRRP